MSFAIRLVALLALFMASPSVWAQPPGFSSQPEGQFFDSRDRVDTDVKAAFEQVPQGGDLPVAIIFDMDPRWHIWTQAGGTPEGVGVFEGAINTIFTVEVSDPSALTTHEDHIQWPEPHVASVAGMGELAVFEGRAIVYLPVTVPVDAPLGEAALTFKLTFQTCDEKTCLAPVWDLELSVAIEIVEADAETALETLDDDFAGFDRNVFQTVRGGAAIPDQSSSDQESDGASATPNGSTLNPTTFGGLILLLLLALVGGFILNLTPCVLPVIPLKIMSLAKTAGNRRRTLALGIAMALGVIGFWMGLGIAIVTISGFTTANQLFQYPLFTIAIGILIAILAVGMCGLFSIQLPQFIYAINPGHDSLHGSFAFGIMAAILSTPCTAPFMGSAMAASVGQAPWLVMSVFGSIGLGMASPYLVLAAFPKLIDRMPRTGPASELIKQLMGLLLLAAAAYFIGVGISGLLANPLEPVNRLYWWPVALSVAAAGFWMAYKTIRITNSGAKRGVFVTLGLFFVVASVYGGNRLSKPDSHGPIHWVYYTPDLFQQVLDDDKIVIMDFTAEWCLNCKLMETQVLESPYVADRIAEDDVVAMKVDLTNRKNTEGNTMLNRTGSVTIPWLVIFDPDGNIVFARNWYTKSMVLDSIEKAANSKTQIAP